MLRPRLCRQISVALFAAWAAAGLALAEIAVSITGGPGLFRAGDSVHGWTFTVGQTIAATHLGLWDQDGDGFLIEHPIGLFRVGEEAPLTSGTISAGGGDPLTDGFRYIDTPDVVLDPGDVYVVAYYTAEDPTDLFVFDGENEVFHPAVNRIQGRWAFPAGGELILPPNSTTQDRYGPNFIFLVELFCGDGIVDPGETCDDAGESPTCDDDCTLPECGDANHNAAAGEDCDGGIICDPDCTLTDGAVLYDQTDDASGNGFPDQDFESTDNTSDSEAADDFEVTDPGGWTVIGVNTPGITSVPGGSSMHVDITFYPDDDGLPAETPVCEFLGTSTYTDAQGELTIRFTTPCELDPGVYWLAQQVRQDFLTDGQHFWSNRASQSNSPAVWRNPLNGFGTGCVDWTPNTVCNVGGGFPDLLFQIIGPEEDDPVPAIGPGGLLLILVTLGGASGYVLARRRGSFSDRQR